MIGPQIMRGIGSRRNTPATCAHVGIVTSGLGSIIEFTHHQSDYWNLLFCPMATQGNPGRKGIIKVHWTPVVSNPANQKPVSFRLMEFLE